jgi:hypothetical protein
MAGIAQVYSSLIGKIKEITSLGFVHIWNNQLQQLEDGDTYVFPFPNAFVEVIAPTNYDPIGQGYAVGELTVRIHIGHEEYDAGNGNFEENTNVFTYRDLIINKLNSFQPTACSLLMKVSETQDFVHTNIYHYIIDFKCSFVDSKGSLDEQKGYIIKQPRTNLIVNGQLVDNIIQNFDNTFDYTFN